MHRTWLNITKKESRLFVYSLRRSRWKSWTQNPKLNGIEPDFYPLFSLTVWERRLYFKRGRRSLRFSTFYPDPVGDYTSLNSSLESDSSVIYIYFSDISTICFSLMLDSGCSLPAGWAFFGESWVRNCEKRSVSYSVLSSFVVETWSNIGGAACLESPQLSSSDNSASKRGATLFSFGLTSYFEEVPHSFSSESSTSSSTLF